MLEGCYICPSCGEEIVVPVDPLVGEHQDYVEDCPVCCRPNLLQVTIFSDDDGPSTDHESFERDSFAGDQSFLDDDEPDRADEDAGSFEAHEVRIAARPE